MPRPYGHATRIGASRRRLALGVLGSLPLAARAVWAGDPRPKLIGFLHSGGPSVENPAQAYLESVLAEQGWVIGRDYRIELRAGYGQSARIGQAAEALVALQPDLLYTGSNAGAVPLRRLTATIPIVVPFLQDPVALGLASSLGRPAGNVTGLTGIAARGLLAKRMQMTVECVPHARRMAALLAVKESASGAREEMEAAARDLGLMLDVIAFDNREAMPAAYERIVALRPDALILSGVGLITQQKEAICAFALRNRLPASYGLREFAQAGLLMSYGVNTGENYRRSVLMVDRILRGAKAGELAIEQPTGYEFAINLRTARAIGVQIPSGMLQRADEVIT